MCESVSIDEWLIADGDGAERKGYIFSFSLQLLAEFEYKIHTYLFFRQTDNIASARVKWASARIHK